MEEGELDLKILPLDYGFVSSIKHLCYFKSYFLQMNEIHLSAYDIVICTDHINIIH